MLANLHKILRKHRIAQDEEHEIIARNAPWYGKPTYPALSQKQADVDLEPIFALARTFRLE